MDLRLGAAYGAADIQQYKELQNYGTFYRQTDLILDAQFGSARATHFRPFAGVLFSQVGGATENMGSHRLLAAIHAGARVKWDHLYSDVRLGVGHSWNTLNYGKGTVPDEFDLWNAVAHVGGGIETCFGNVGCMSLGTYFHVEATPYDNVGARQSKTTYYNKGLALYLAYTPSVVQTATAAVDGKYGLRLSGAYGSPTVQVTSKESEGNSDFRQTDVMLDVEYRKPLLPSSIDESLLRLIPVAGFLFSKLDGSPSNFGSNRALAGLHLGVRAQALRYVYADFRMGVGHAWNSLNSKKGIAPDDASWNRYLHVGGGLSWPKTQIGSLSAGLYYQHERTISGGPEVLNSGLMAVVGLGNN